MKPKTDLVKDCWNRIGKDIQVNYHISHSNSQKEFEGSGLEGLPEKDPTFDYLALMVLHL